MTAHSQAKPPFLRAKVVRDTSPSGKGAITPRSSSGHCARPGHPKAETRLCGLRLDSFVLVVVCVEPPSITGAG
jgi:hypothetical protein